MIRDKLLDKLFCQTVHGIVGDAKFVGINRNVLSKIGVLPQINAASTACTNVPNASAARLIHMRRRCRWMRRMF